MNRLQAAKSLIRKCHLLSTKLYNETSMNPFCIYLINTPNGIISRFANIKDISVPDLKLNYKQVISFIKRNYPR